jgi:hypothetical protein
MRRTRARRNRDLCRQLAQHVQIVGGLLRKLQIPELRRQPETRRPLEQLDDALFRAYKLVRSCSQQQESRSQLYQMLKGADVACKLRAALEEIDRYIQLIPMITLVAAIAARVCDISHTGIEISVRNFGPPGKSILSRNFRFFSNFYEFSQIQLNRIKIFPDGHFSNFFIVSTILTWSIHITRLVFISRFS